MLSLVISPSPFITIDGRGHWSTQLQIESKMPIGAQEWRIRTGMINASRGSPFFTRAPKTIPVKHNREQHADLPPPTWKGYRAATVTLCVPVLYKFYTAVTTIIVCLLKGSTATATRTAQFRGEPK